MKQIQSAGGLVINSEGKVLLVTNRIESVTFPKGSIEPGETPIEAARREIMEESGLTELRVGAELGIIVRPGRTDENPAVDTVVKHIHMFLVRTNERTKLQPQAPDVKSAIWVEADEVVGLLSRAEEADFFRKIWPQIVRADAAGESDVA